MTRRAMMYLVLAISVATTGRAAEIPAELQQAIRVRDEAVEKQDVSTWDRLTMPEFIAVRPDGKLMNKAERLAQLKAEKPEARPKPKQERFIRYGDTVLRPPTTTANEWDAVDRRMGEGRPDLARGEFAGYSSDPVIQMGGKRPNNVARDGASRRR